MADEPERAECTHVDLGMPDSASDRMTVHFVRQADALTSCSSAAVATSIMHGASDDIAVAIGTAVKNTKRAPIGQRNLGEFWVCSYICKVRYCICWVYIIPKWLINDS